MEINNRSNKNEKLPDSTNGLSRRSVLMTATVAAGALAGAPSVLADTVAAGNFGAPLVEVHVPACVLTPEQKSAIKGLHRRGAWRQEATARSRPKTFCADLRNRRGWLRRQRPGLRPPHQIGCRAGTPAIAT